jgi:hypothetical protein
VLYHDFQYKLNNINLSRIDEFNDLGLLVTPIFSWKPHIQQIVSKANRILGLIKRTLGLSAPTRAKLLLYNSMVTSILNYLSVTWFPNKGDLALIEGVQRRATKYILSDHTSDYKTRLTTLGMLPLSYYKEINDLCFLYKCLHGFNDLNILEMTPLRENLALDTRINQDNFRLKVPQFRTETSARFFTNRIVKIWNTLPEDIRTTICTNKKILPFKNKLLSYYFSKLSTSFNDNNTCTWVSNCRCAACRPL